MKLVRSIVYVNGEPYYPKTDVEHREPPRDDTYSKQTKEGGRAILYIRLPIENRRGVCNK